MTLVDSLPKDDNGNIILSPGGEINGELLDGTVSPTWFQTKFPVLAGASVPLSDTDFATLKGIDQFWSQNADTWRSKGII